MTRRGTETKGEKEIGAETETERKAETATATATATEIGGGTLRRIAATATEIVAGRNATDLEIVTGVTGTHF